MAAISAPPRILPSGDSAITVEFSSIIDDAANARVRALDRLLARDPVAGVTETVPTYRSLLVHYDPLQVDFDALSKRLINLAQLPVPPVTKARRWRIPVVYGGEHGIDLEDFAMELNATPDEIVARHVAGDYRVAMIGFTPGWSYLSGLEDSLHMPRRQNPRLRRPRTTGLNQKRFHSVCAAVTCRMDMSITRPSLPLYAGDDGRQSIQRVAYNKSLNVGVSIVICHRAAKAEPRG